MIHKKEHDNNKRKTELSKPHIEGDQGYPPLPELTYEEILHKKEKEAIILNHALGMQQKEQKMKNKEIIKKDKVIDQEFLSGWTDR